VLTKFIYSLIIGISLLFIPTPASAEDIIINLDATTAYVDVVISIDTTTVYTITTTTGLRLEVIDSRTVERVAWVDSWLWLYRGVADSATVNAIRADDDSNHSQDNQYASKITGTLTADTYTIRATSYNYVVAGQRPIGTYILSSNLIPPPVDTTTIVVDTSTVAVDTNTTTVDGTTATIDTSAAVVPVPAPEPPVVTPEPPAIIIPPPAIEPEPPAVVEEPPVVIEEPPVVEEPPVEAEEPPDVVEEAPIPVEEPPAEEVIQADEVDLETLAPETPVQLDNGVVLEASTVVALQLLDNPAELIAAIFDNPAAVLIALSNIGADMSEEERTASENTIIASVIAGQAAINAVGVASVARTATPTGGGASVPTNDNIKLLRRRKP
jgi:hypothetical protein